MKKPQRLIDMKRRREIAESLKQLGPLVEQIAATGCGVSMLAVDYAKRALKGTPYDNPVIGLSYPKWTVGTVGLDEFTASSRAVDYKGDFFRIKRVLRNDLPVPLSVDEQCNFINVVQARVSHRTAPMLGYMIVVGELLHTLFEMSPYLVEYRVDHGIHLLIQEKPGTNRYLEIYLGGWMDEVAYHAPDWIAQRTKEQ